MTQLRHRPRIAVRASDTGFSPYQFDAFAFVRGAVPDPELSKQLEAYAHAVELIRWTMPDIIDPEHIYMPCELTNLI